MPTTLANQAVDDIVSVLQLSNAEKLRLAHRLLADVAQASAGTSDAGRLVVLMAGIRAIAEKMDETQTP